MSTATLLSMNYRKREFNCMGFAIGVLAWLCPRSFDSYLDAPNFDPATCIEGLAAETLRCHPHLRRVKSPRGIHKSRKVIGLRAMTECRRPWGRDFHFIVREGGVWYHKPGRSDIVEMRSPVTKPWHETANLYDSPAVWFVED